MHHASYSPATLPASQPVTGFIRAMRAMAQDASAGPTEHISRAPLPGQNKGRGLMRRMLVAAAIAGGLVALWALLVPVVA